jgi:hypothetical protein
MADQSASQNNPQPSTTAVPAWEQDIINKCDEAGLQVMAQVLFVLHDREVLPAAALDAITPEDITEFYEGFIGPAIDKIEESLAEEHGTAN